MAIQISKLNLSDSQDTATAFPVMRQLRSHLNLEQFRSLCVQMKNENYELWAAFQGGKLMGLVSTRVYTDLVRGPHVYVDDLVTSEEARSQGVGAALLKHVENWAKEQELPTLRLCCVITNEGGMKFYRREGWKERAYALVKKVG